MAKTVRTGPTDWSTLNGATRPVRIHEKKWSKTFRFTRLFRLNLLIAVFVIALLYSTPLDYSKYIV